MKETVTTKFDYQINLIERNQLNYLLISTYVSYIKIKIINYETRMEYSAKFEFIIRHFRKIANISIY